MRNYALLLLFLPMAFPSISTAGSGPTSITATTEQAPATGEVKRSPIPKQLFFEKEKGLVSEQAALTAGYLDFNDHPSGYITGFQEPKEIADAGDTVYIDRGKKSGLVVGRRYYAYNRGDHVFDPDSGDDFGYLVQIAGLVEVTEATDTGATAKVVKTYRSLYKGCAITPEFKVIAPKMDPDRPLEEKTISGAIIAVNNGKGEFAAGDFVYLNVGREEGVAEGDVFRISETPGSYDDTKSGAAGPGKSVGKAQAILVRKYSTTAIVTHSTCEITVGDKVSYVQER